MRFDLEQFLALTMALGTAGALGVAVYSSQDATPAAPQATGAEVEEAEQEPFPEADDEPPPAAKTTTTPPSPAPIPALDAAPQELEAAPGPQVETMNW